MISSHTKDNIPINKLKQHSKKRVYKTCDRCGKKSTQRWQDITKARRKHNTDLDYCPLCSMKEYCLGDKNPAKQLENRQKISLATRGKSKTFKEGTNPRVLKRKITSGGYILIWDEKKRIYVQEHRVVMSKFLKRELHKGESIHHINGNKTDNDITNLYLCQNEREHQRLHQQLQQVSLDLVRRGIVAFGQASKQYYISPKIDLHTLDPSIGFDEISLKQNHSSVDSRLQTDITSEVIRGIKLKVPLIAANMSTVINTDLYLALAKHGALGVLHRAQSTESIIEEIKYLKGKVDIVAASIGSDENQYDICKQLVSSGANVIFIDVAHGYTDQALGLARKIKKEFSEIKLVLGNTINERIIHDVYDFIDAIKVGLAQGSVCETKNTAGCTEGQFSAVYRFKRLSQDFGIPIISDGSVKEPADFTKALAAGAAAVMAGKIFAACPESAAPLIELDGRKAKLYAGMASRYVQERWKGGLKPGTCPEGTIKYLDIGEPVEKLIERYTGALRSGMSYQGAHNLKELRENAVFVRQSHASLIEGHPHHPTLGK